VWKACRIPYTNSPDAAAAYRKAHDAGYIHTDDNPPRGAIVYWTGGSAKHGHVAISLGGSPVKIATTDAKPTGTETGEHLLSWPRTQWGLTYKGWSWSYAHIPIPKE
jgi:hypothetical protein